MCVFRVTGERFDVDLCSSLTEFTVYKVFRVGEPRFRSQPEGRRYEVSGFTVEVSRHPGAYLFDQVPEAVAFLKEHEQAIERLRRTPGVDDIRLDFPVDLQIDREKVMAQYEYFPPELVSRAGALGVGLEISIYPPDLQELAERRASNRAAAPDSSSAT